MQHSRSGDDAGVSLLPSGGRGFLPSRVQIIAGFLMSLVACSGTHQSADAGAPCGALNEYCCGTVGTCNAGLTCLGGLGCVQSLLEADAGADAGDIDSGTTDVGPSGDAGASGGGGQDAGAVDAGLTTDAGPMACGCSLASGCMPCPTTAAPICTLTNQCVTAQYTVNATAGTVTDGVTNLVWQQTVSSNPCPADDGGFPSGCTWSDAQTYCQSLSLGGLSGWRLPTLAELFSLVEGANTPSIEATAFPNTPAEPFWTSTTAFSNDAYVVYFNSGETTAFDLTFAFDVRCVTSGGS